MTAQDFWKWFKNNESQLLQLLSEDPACYIDEVTSRIRRVPPGFNVETVLDHESGAAELAVSADGDPNKIGHVLMLVRSAPVMDHWKIVAFRQRGEAKSVVFQGTEISIGDLSFKGSIDDQMLKVTFYIDRLKHGVDDPLAGAALLLMDEAIGEYDAMILVRRLDAKPRDSSTPVDALPFTKLREYIDTVRGKVEPLPIKFKSVDYD